MPNNINMVERRSQQITERLKEEIESCGKTRTEIAKEVGISKPTLSQYLSGRAYPSLVTFAKLCEVIDCSSDDILGIKRY